MNHVFPDICRAIFCNMSARCVRLQSPSAPASMTNTFSILVVTEEAIWPQTGKLSGSRLFWCLFVST